MIQFLFLETFAKIIPIFYVEKLNDTKKERKEEWNHPDLAVTDKKMKGIKISSTRIRIFFLTFNLKSTCKRAQNKAHSTLIRSFLKRRYCKRFARRVFESFLPVYMNAKTMEIR